MMIVQTRDGSSNSLTKKPLLLLLLATLLVGGCTKGAAEKPLRIVQGMQQPAAVAAEQMQPGLTTMYFYDFYRYVSSMPKGEQIARKGKPGPPVRQLNHRFENQPVFDSGQNKGVGMIMEGYFYLPQPGEYLFQAVSNDGFELLVNNVLVVSDPGVHGARFSEKGRITVAGAGWFPVQIRYFQRKGTAALELYWQPPGSSAMSIVPAEVYAHRVR